LDPFVTGPTSAEAVSAASMAPKKALVERALGAELSRKRGYRPAATKPRDADTRRHGASVKTVFSADAPLHIEVHKGRT
jgi:putative transposase